MPKVKAASSAGAVGHVSLLSGREDTTYRPSASGILFELYPGGTGPGKLRVTNNSVRNAICKLIDLTTGTKVVQAMAGTAIGVVLGAALIEWLVGKRRCYGR